jgi:hypothetical protein
VPPPLLLRTLLVSTANRITPPQTSALHSGSHGPGSSQGGQCPLQFRHKSLLWGTGQTPGAREGGTSEVHRPHRYKCAVRAIPVKQLCASPREGGTSDLRVPTSCFLFLLCAVCCVPFNCLPFTSRCFGVLLTSAPPPPSQCFVFPQRQKNVAQRSSWEGAAGACSVGPPPGVCPVPVLLGLCSCVRCADHPG